MNVWTVLLLVIVLAALAFGLRRVLVRVTVFEYQHAARFVKGKLVDLLKPGSYWYYTPNTTIQVIDARRRVLTIPGQDIMSSDAVSIKVSLFVELEVTEPEAALLNAQDFEAAIYARSQAALRTAVGETAIEDVLRSRAQLGASVHSQLEPEAKRLGIALISVSVKDIMFPGALKEAFSQAARAKQEGQAALERARGENAALRSLANAARQLEKNPHLLELRVLHAISDAGKVVVNFPDLADRKPGQATHAEQTNPTSENDSDG